MNYRAPDGLTHFRGPNDEDLDHYPGEDPEKMWRMTLCEHEFDVRWDGNRLVPVLEVVTCIQCIGAKRFYEQKKNPSIGV